MEAMPKKFPAEFKRDVVRVVRRGDLTIAEVATDFDISVESVRRWMHQADVDDGAIFVAEIGDIGRFSSAQKLASWAGLTPKHRESDLTKHPRSAFRGESDPGPSSAYRAPLRRAFRPEAVPNLPP
jgi:transposase-like protein